MDFIEANKTTFFLKGEDRTSIRLFSSRKHLKLILSNPALVFVFKEKKTSLISCSKFGFSFI